MTRAVGAGLAEGARTFVDREPIDLAKAAAQHAAYVEAICRAGAEVDVLPADDSLPDSVFVEDGAVILERIVSPKAVVTRPGLPSRRRETPAIAAALSSHLQLEYIVAPGTLDGGDVLRLGDLLLVGLSSRTNREGLSQLARIAKPYGISVEPVTVHGCLHLKTAVTALGEETLLVNPAWIDTGALHGLEVLEVPPEEPFGANVLVVKHTVIVSARWERTRRIVEKAAHPVVALDISEFEKAEGGVTCLSLVYSTYHAY